MIAIAKACEHPAAAVALLMHLGSPTVSLEVVHDPVFGSAPFRLVHLNDHRDGWLNYGLDNAGTANLLEALRSVAEPRIVNPPMRLRTLDQRAYRTVLLDGVRRCLTSAGDAATTLAEVEKRWREMDAARPIDHKAVYLRSLTLIP
jgi:hypothetical protein